ncbi:NupC/NupG family nucleoside CNT transporter [Bacillus sp. M6-12]|uniref:NupC/NupG family nucleoside CNT transporter n=1 Tax=Bacillus sp. M6-12 TaxID=2054166 RepID=UPI000C794FDF|nr:nucleoside transporter C-terminal domain-containing protein [Bacillus sp. M6-12]PLS15064.1 NupC/NupG family nucleoside CNT transporter [Bacillus sp. M6-12]
MNILIGIIGIVVFIGLAWLMSNNKKQINFKAVGIMILLQVIITWLLLNTKGGLKLIEVISNGFSKVISYGTEGINFVVGGWIPEGQSPFFVNVLLIIVFTSTLLSILTHLRILPLVIKYIGGLLSKVTGLPTVESFNAVNSIFFGQSESILAIKSQLDTLDKNRLFIVSTSAMASVSASIVGAYMTMLPAKYVLVAMILNMFSALIMASIVAPIGKDIKEKEIDIKDIVQSKNIFDAIGIGALDGGKVVLIVSAMLIAYIGLLALINGVLNGLLGFDLNTIMGYVFAPIAFLMGVPASEMVTAGSIMGTKLVANEFVAIMQFQPLIETLSDRTVGIISTFLISFAAFGSIGIISGSIQAINGEKAKEVSSFGLKMLLVATMSSALSATIVGLFM